MAGMMRIINLEEWGEEAQDPEEAQSNWDEEKGPKSDEEEINVPLLGPRPTNDVEAKAWRICFRIYFHIIMSCCASATIWAATKGDYLWYQRMLLIVGAFMYILVQYLSIPPASK